RVGHRAGARSLPPGSLRVCRPRYRADDGPAPAGRTDGLSDRPHGGPAPRRGGTAERPAARGVCLSGCRASRPAVVSTPREARVGRSLSGVPRAAMADVLVVDDAPGLAAVTSAVLSAVGHRVRIVESGAGALAQLRERPADVIVLDRDMPGMDGWEVLRR